MEVFVMAVFMMESPMTSRWPSTARLLGRLAALLGTSYFLIATSQYEPESNQKCNHSSQTVAFHVTGTCGPEGDVTMTSFANDCAISVQGGSAVGLPSAGRYVYSQDHPASLTVDLWTLSSYLPEGASTVVQDAAPFGVQTDAQAPSGGGPPAPTVSHGSLVIRECKNSEASPLSVICRDGSAGTAGCYATLTVK
jgi:hypothetical protein